MCLAVVDRNLWLNCTDESPTLHLLPPVLQHVTRWLCRQANHLDSIELRLQQASCHACCSLLGEVQHKRRHQAWHDAYCNDVHCTGTMAVQPNLHYMLQCSHT